jgi:hypothetical protein
VAGVPWGGNRRRDRWAGAAIMPWDGSLVPTMPWDARNDVIATRSRRRLPWGGTAARHGHRPATRPYSA